MSDLLHGQEVDVVIVGAGAAGLATGIFSRRAAPTLRVIVVDGARAPGAKILVSGGARCNVTNRDVTPADFNGGRPGSIRRVLGALPGRETVAFFAGLGVPLHEEAHGKLFPDSNRARDVLDALIGALRAAGADLRPGHRVLAITRRPHGFDVVTSQGTFQTRRVVLATGGLALPKSGSDGAGYAFATALGHTIVPTTPALVPLVFDDDPAHDWTGAITGVAQETRLTVRRDQAHAASATGAMLWTHFGVSGPAVLDISRHWLRDRLEGRHPGLSAALSPDHRFDTLEAWWLARAQRSPRSSVTTALADLLPASVGAALAGHAGLSGTLLADLPRESRRRLIHLLLDCPLPVVGSRGYTYAEVTAGGIPLAEIDPATMESRLVPGLHLVGEILDVDGRLGGFNFQWAWASAKVAGDALRFTLTA